MTLPDTGIDLALAVERLVPQAAFGTARKTDIDADDYAALSRTWYDSRPIPNLGQLIAAHQQNVAEQTNRQLARLERRNEILLRRQVATLPDIGEIQSVTSLVDAKQVMLKLRAVIAYHEAVLLALQLDEGLFE